MEDYRDFLRWGGVARVVKNFTEYYYCKVGRRDIGIAWVLEVQRRGVPHYHLLICMNGDVKFPKPDRWFFRWGFTQIRRMERFSRGYLAKYLSKGRDGGKGYQLEFSELRKRVGEWGRRVRSFGISWKLQDWFTKLNFSARRLLREIFGLQYKARCSVWRGVVRVSAVEWTDGVFVWILRWDQFLRELDFWLLRLWQRVMGGGG